MLIYVILIIIIAGLLILTKIGREILKGILKIVVICGLLYFGYLWLKFMMEWTSKI
jgi:hypothetical protein